MPSFALLSLKRAVAQDSISFGALVASVFLIITTEDARTAVVALWAYSEVGEVDEQLISAGFELHQVWVPNLDRVANSVHISLLVKQFCWFERALFYAARVLNASKMGSHSEPSRPYLTLSD